MALLNDSDGSSKNIERLPGSGGLYILKQSHLLFGIVSSEQIHSEKLSSKSLILLQIIPLLTDHHHYFYLYLIWPLFRNHQD